MALTAKEALDHVRHALSADKMPSLGGLRILNDAGEYLVNMHPWRWLEGEQVRLSLLPDQPYVWLPENVHSVNALVATDTVNANITFTTAAELARRRASVINTSFHYWAALVYAKRGAKKRYNFEFTQGYTGPNPMTISDSSRVVVFRFDSGTSTDTVKYNCGFAGNEAKTAQLLVKAINDAGMGCYAEYDSDLGLGGFWVESRFEGLDDSDHFSIDQGTVGNLPPAEVTNATHKGAYRPRLDLWPTPGTYEKGAFTAYYRRGWDPVRSDDDGITIPSFVEPLYINLVRNVALGYERDAEGDVAMRLGNVRNSTLFNDTRRRDSMTQSNFGPLQNGAAVYDYGLNDQMWNFDQTGGPL